MPGVFVPLAACSARTAGTTGTAASAVTRTCATTGTAGAAAITGTVTASLTGAALRGLIGQLHTAFTGALLHALVVFEAIGLALFAP